MPVPPYPDANVPATVTAPVVALLGVNPVDPNEIVVTGVVTAVEANSFTVPELFLKYNFSSAILIANSPLDKFPADGTLVAVVL